GEQWRLGGNGFTGTNRDRLAFEYSTDATSATTGTWQSAPQLTFYAPNTTGTAGPLDGNLAANRTNINDTVFVGSVASGSVFWVRWKDIDVVGGDDGLAVEDAAFAPIFFTPSVYYSKPAGDLNSLGTWGNQTDGGGLSPANFTASGQTFIIANQANATIAANWVVSGAGSKVVVSTGHSFTIPSTATLTGTVDVEANGTLVIENAASPTVGVLDENSTVVYGANAPVVQIVNGVATFGNLTFTGTGTRVIGSSLRVANQLLLDNGNLDQNNAANFYVIYFRRDLTVNAGVTYGALYNSNVSLQPYGSFKQTVTANGGNTVNASRFLMNVNNAGGSLITSGVDLKTDTLQLGANTTLMLTHLKLNANAAAFFLDNGNTIKVAGDVEAAGTTGNYSLNGTIELNGSTGTSNFRQDNNTGATAVIKAQLNNIRVNTTGNADVKFQPQTGAATVVINGNVTLDGSSTNPVRLYNNNYHLKGNFTNNRTVDVIDQGTSTLVFNGTGDQYFTTSFAAGDTLYKVQINKSNGDVIMNGGDLVVANNFNGTDALLKTNVNKLVLGNTATIAENDSAYVLGNVWTTRFLNQNVNNTFGGLGIEINALNLVPGNTLVKRSTGTQLPLGCYVSIKRQFDVIPTVNNSMNATVKIAYLEGPELNGQDENFLRLFQYANGVGPWTVNYNATNSTANNYVITAGVQSLDRYTLANPLPAAGTAYATGGSVNNPNTVICPNTSTTLTLEGSLGYIQWQQSADGTTGWSNVTGATNATYTTPSLSDLVFYRAVVSNPCYDISSNTVRVDQSATPVITFSNITSTAVTVSWLPFVSGQYNVSWSGAGTGTQNGVTGNSFTLSGLTPNATLNVTVTKAAPVCAGTAPGIASTNTLCAKVTGVTLTPLTYQFPAPSLSQQPALIVNWTAIPGVSAYKIYYRSLLQGASWSVKLHNSATTTDTIRPLYASHTYAVQLVAMNCPVTGQEGDKSTVVFGVPPVPTACAPTPVITATSNCANQITVNFISGTSPQVRVTLRRLTPSFTAGVNYTVTSGAALDFNVGTQYAGSVWEVFARSICAATGNDLYSPVSNIVYVTVKAACPAVQNLVLSQPDCNGFSASWNANNCNNATPAPYYQLYLKKSTSTVYYSYSVGSTNSKDVNWVQPGFSYDVFVRTVSCNGAVSPNSTVETINVPACRNDEAGDENNYGNDAPLDAHGAGSVSIFPNPTNGAFSVLIPDAGENALVSVQLIDALGKVLAESVALEANGPTQLQLRIPGGAASGVYFVRTTTNGQSDIQRIVYYK
ncbi:MAG TPA: T9SS type A sorting domain-containing protein, partial [Chitinophagales bacterium]|nr:T9SS type A sorting domain-containing protein [Chitinophagales bacterium]